MSPKAKGISPEGQCHEADGYDRSMTWYDQMVDATLPSDEPSLAIMINDVYDSMMCMTCTYPCFLPAESLSPTGFIESDAFRWSPCTAGWPVSFVTAGICMQSGADEPWLSMNFMKHLNFEQPIVTQSA